MSFESYQRLSCSASESAFVLGLCTVCFEKQMQDLDHIDLVPSILRFSVAEFITPLGVEVSPDRHRGITISFVLQDRLYTVIIAPQLGRNRPSELWGELPKSRYLSAPRLRTVSFSHPLPTLTLHTLQQWPRNAPSYI